MLYTCTHMTTVAVKGLKRLDCFVGLVKLCRYYYCSCALTEILPSAIIPRGWRLALC